MTDELNKTGATEEVATEETEQKGKYYTDEEIALIEQRAGDKRITQFQKTLEKKQREAEKLRNMNEEDKKNYELEQRELAIEEKEKQLAILENKQEGLSILLEKGLDPKLIDFVLVEDAEEMYKKIGSLEKAMKASVKAEVEKRIGGSSPKKAEVDSNNLTKDQFNKLSLAELQQLKNENPELYQEMTN